VEGWQENERRLGLVKTAVGVETRDRGNRPTHEDTAHNVDSDSRVPSQSSRLLAVAAAPVSSHGPSGGQRGELELDCMSSNNCWSSQCCHGLVFSIS